MVCCPSEITPRIGTGTASLPLIQESGEVSSRAAEEGPRQQHLAGYTVADNPKHLVAHIWLHPIDSQQDLTLLLESGLDPLLIRQVQGDQFFVTLQQIGDRALCDAYSL